MIIDCNDCQYCWPNENQQRTGVYLYHSCRIKDRTVYHYTDDRGPYAIEPLLNCPMNTKEEIKQAYLGKKITVAGDNSWKTMTGILKDIRINSGGHDEGIIEFPNGETGFFIIQYNFKPKGASANA